MFLTPFVDFGEPIERFLGLPPMDREEDKDQELTDQLPLAHRSEHAFVNTSQKVRIIGVTDRIKIISASNKGTVLEGTGIALGSGPLDQSKAYFEVRVEQDGTKFTVGAVGRNPTTVLSENWQVLSKVPNSISSGSLGPFTTGEIVGVLIDISDFPPSVSAFQDNDTLIKTVSLAVRGDVWPAIALMSGSLSVVFKRNELKFLSQQRISRGIEAIMVGRSII
jgi:hypothetical protein